MLSSASDLLRHFDPEYDDGDAIGRYEPVFGTDATIPCTGGTHTVFLLLTGESPKKPIKTKREQKLKALNVAVTHNLIPTCAYKRFID